MNLNEQRNQSGIMMPKGIPEIWENEELKEKVRDIMRAIGEDPNREGLLETPKRYLKALWEMTHPEQFNLTTFDSEGMDQMIIQNNIPFYSLCEHHIISFFGVGSIAYIPNKKIVGLSKLARTLEWFARGLQNQERITQNVADYLWKELSPQGVGVYLKAKHMCMEQRGAKKHDTWTTTIALRGVFLEKIVKDEFLSLIK